MDNKRPISELMEATMSKLRETIDTRTIVGDPIVTPDGITLIPVSRITLGFGAGGSEFAQKASNADKNFGGGSGAGIKIVPVAFIVIKEGVVRIMTIEAPAYSTMDRVVDSAPTILDQVSAMMKKKGE